MTATTFAVHPHAAAVRRLRVLARLLDSSFTLPGVDFRFGLDPLIGLVPVWGDVISGAISFYIIFEGAKLGASRRTLALMVLNVLLDLLIGAVPVLGDLLDFGMKANLRNLRLLGIEPLDE